MKKKDPGLLTALLAHLVLILSAMMLTFFVIDRINEAMAFLNNDITKWLLAVFALASAALAAAVIVRRERARKPKESRKGDQHEEK